jgi:protein-disulfide isomerase
MPIEPARSLWHKPAEFSTGQSMKRRFPGVRAIAVMLLLAGMGYFAGSPSQAATFAVTPNDHALGSPEAPVTVIEYGAPSCPVCAQFNTEVISRLKTTYIETGKVRYVFRVWPLRPSDAAAEKIARCLPSSKYFSFLDTLFRNQPLWDEELGAHDPYKGLTQLAHRFGLSAGRVNRCIGNTAQDADINRIAAHGEVKYHVNGTPTIVINGVAQPSGSLSWSALKTLVEAALAGKQGKTAQP